MQRVLPGRLGAELGSGAQDHVRVAQQLLEGGLVAAASGGQRVVLRQRALAHVGRRDRRIDQLREPLQLRFAIGAAIACLIVICVMLLFRHRRRREQRAAAQAGTEQHYDQGFDLKCEPEAPATNPLLSFVADAYISKAPVPMTGAPSDAAELDSRQLHEIGTS